MLKHCHAFNITLFFKKVLSVTLLSSSDFSETSVLADLSLRSSVEPQWGLILCKLFTNMFNETFNEADALKSTLVDSVFSLFNRLNIFDMFKLCQWSFFRAHKTFSSQWVLREEISEPSEASLTTFKKCEVLREEVSERTNSLSLLQLV